VVVSLPNNSFFKVKSVGVTVSPGLLEFGFEPVETPVIGELFDEVELPDEFEELLEEFLDEFFVDTLLLQAVASKTRVATMIIFFILLLVILLINIFIKCRGR
jgi:hypothetical protein